MEESMEHRCEEALEVPLGTEQNILGDTSSLAACLTRFDHPIHSNGNFETENHVANLRTRLLGCSSSKLVSILLELIQSQPTLFGLVNELLDHSGQSINTEINREILKDVSNTHGNCGRKMIDEENFKRSAKEIRLNEVKTSIVQLKKELIELGNSVIVLRNLERSSYEQLSMFMCNRTDLLLHNAFDVDLKIQDVKEGLRSFRSFVERMFASVYEESRSWLIQQVKVRNSNALQRQATQICETLEQNGEINEEKPIQTRKTRSVCSTANSDRSKNEKKLLLESLANIYPERREEYLKMMKTPQCVTNDFIETSLLHQRRQKRKDFSEFAPQGTRSRSRRQRKGKKKKGLLSLLQKRNHEEPEFIK
eukprot:TRINITY_DN5326_c0_g2_i1.p1 TRINITY_DN5326_c0_g2~~TRINITY_DN5326_c0_g2_i1.p1  ORF type:complete len:366 (-),score=50.34 TRINITY_DN5326_c0_g2_i1:118-1215(-)